jgi:hypothetical protein
MLKISRKQREAMATRLSEDLPDKIFETLNERLNEHIRSRRPDLTRDHVAGWIKNANAYGIIGRKALTQFAVLCLLAGENFYRDPDINMYLQMVRMTGDQKMKLLVTMINASAERSGR